MRSSGFKLREIFISLEELKCLNVECINSKYLKEDQGLRFIQEETKHFGSLDLGEVAHWLAMRIYRNFSIQKIWKKQSEIHEIPKCEILNSSGSSIERGHVERYQHFAESQIRKVKGQSCENLRNVKSRFDCSCWLERQCGLLI
jgi:hypothetical protein